MKKNSLYSSRWTFMTLILRNCLYFLKRKLFNILGNENFEKILYISRNGTSLQFRKRNFVIIQEMETLKNFLYFRKKRFELKKTPKNLLLKSILYFGKWNILPPTLKNFLYFRKKVTTLENKKKTYISFQIWPQKKKVSFLFSIFWETFVTFPTILLLFFLFFRKILKI